MPDLPPILVARPDRRPGFWVLAAVVAIGHLLLGNRLAEDRVGWGAGDAPPPRIDAPTSDAPAAVVAIGVEVEPAAIAIVASHARLLVPSDGTRNRIGASAIRPPPQPGSAA